MVMIISSFDANDFQYCTYGCGFIDIMCDVSIVVTVDYYFIFIVHHWWFAPPLSSYCCLLWTPTRTITWNVTLLLQHYDISHQHPTQNMK